MKGRYCIRYQHGFTTADASMARKNFGRTSLMSGSVVVRSFR